MTYEHRRIRLSWATFNVIPHNTNPLNGPFAHQETTFLHGDKVLPYSLSHIIDNWSRTVSITTCSCAAIQSESNRLFFVPIIIQCVLFIDIFRKFQWHRFFAIFREMSSCGDCGSLSDGEHSWSGICVISWEFVNSACKSNVQNCKASRPPTTQMSLASHWDHLCVTYPAVCRCNCSYKAMHRVHVV